jgi:cell migration-inducing and hyaluronan-binding protein
VSKQRRSFLLASLLPAFLLAGVFAVVHAQDGKSPAVKQTRWSDAATWPDKRVPRAGDKVSIPAGKDVLLDVTPPALGGVDIEGKLTFADTRDLELTTEWVMVHGELEIGTEAKPHTRKATITLTNSVPDEEPMKDMGDRGIMIMGGTLNLHGDRTNAWTKLAATANAGATSIEVLNAAGWKAGDEIVLASTDFDPRQAERRTIASIKGNAITLDKKLDYMHFGKITFDVDERGEVGLLTRNIKLQASADAEQSFQGGHVMAMGTSKMFVEGVEFNRMGQNLTLAAVPDPLASGRRCEGPVHQERLDPRHLQPLRDGARHEFPARRKQRDLQHRWSLLLPRRRRGARQPVRAQPGYPGQVPYLQGLRPDQSRRKRREQGK